MKNEKLYKTIVLLLIFYFLRLILYELNISLPLGLFPVSKLISLEALLPLRISLAFIFLWYAFDHISSGLEFNGIGNKCLQKIRFKNTVDFTFLAKLWGIIELLISISFVFGAYLDVFSLVASIFLFAIIFAYYFASSVLLFRDVAIFGACLSLFLLTLT